MTIQTNKLIEDLVERTRQNINAVELLKQKSEAELNRKANPTQWSALECIEHLNLYGDFYLPEIETRITEANPSGDPVFKSGWLGNYFAKSMLPKEKLNKMKTFKDKNPLGSRLDKSVLDRFIAQQSQMLKLLNAARKVSLRKVKTSISISKWIKLRLGDTFRVVVYHNQRHIVQAKKALH